MAYDIGVGVPTGEVQEEPTRGAPESIASPGGYVTSGVESAPRATAPERSAGGEYDLFGQAAGTLDPVEYTPSLVANDLQGSLPVVEPAESPGDPPPPPVGLPFYMVSQTETGSLEDVEPQAPPYPVVGDLVIAGEVSEGFLYLPSAEAPERATGGDYDLLGQAFGDLTYAYVEPETIVPLTAPDPGALPSPGPAFPPVPDFLPPDLPLYGTIEASQVNGDPKGRTQVTINWVAPTTSQELSGEYLDDATGAAQDVVAEYFPVQAGTYDLFEVTGFTGGGGDTLLSLPASQGALKLTVTSTVGFTVNSWVEVEEGAQKEYGQILAINGSVLTLYNPLIEGDWTGAATVKNVDVLQKTETTDYTVVTSTGTFSLLAGQFTATNPVFARYKQAITDLDGFKLYRIQGQEPLPDGCLLGEVTGYPGVITIDDALAAGATQAVETLDSLENGKTWTLYLFAQDANGNVSRGQAIYVETFISRIQDLIATPGTGQITLSWTANAEANFDGVNIYRSPGGSFDPAQATKVNSLLVTGTSFEDGPGNVINRRTPGEISYPLGGLTYSYSVEAQDTTTDWDTGTQNQSLDPSKAAIDTATKTD